MTKKGYLPVWRWRQRFTSEKEPLPMTSNNSYCVSKDFLSPEVKKYPSGASDLKSVSIFSSSPGVLGALNKASVEGAE